MLISKLFNYTGYFAIVTGLFFILSCASESGDGDTEELDGHSIEEPGTFEQEEESVQVKKVGKVFYTIPSPLELTSIIKKAGASYDKEILNSVDNLSKYVTQTSMALNLGIYGADLSYSSIFEQTQETMHYFAAAKKLADDLGITSAFGESTVKRIQENLNNRDSLMSIISDSYWETDAYLKENKRSSTSALVIAGGWIEGLYISTQLAGKIENNKGIVSRIGEQKLTLNNLVAMLQNFQEEEVKPVIDSLQELQEAFELVEITYSREEPTTDPNSMVTTLHTTSKITISVETLAIITDKINSLRTNIVK